MTLSIKSMGLTALLVVAVMMPLCAQQKPNVLFIAVDDMNDWIGCLSDVPRALTPNIDRLAARGVNFTNAHSPGVYCAPSRTSIFTGQYASTTGCYEYQIYFAHHPELVPLQSSFHAAGYLTYGTGKLFHHGEGCIDLRDWTEFKVRSERQRRTGWPIDSWGDDIPKPAEDPADATAPSVVRTKKGEQSWGILTNEQEPEMDDSMRVAWTIAKLKEKHEKPFFLGMGLYAPHLPNYCPQKYYDLYKRDDVPLPAYKGDDLEDLPEPIKTQQKKREAGNHKKYGDSVKESIHGYLACISYADAMIGRVLKALEESPYADNTIIVLWSDHGYHLGEKGHWGKKTLWQRTSHVPFIWAGPTIAQGATTNVTASLIDMYPTFVEMCGLPVPKQKLEGVSQAAVLADPSKAKDRDVYIPAMEPNSYAIINRDWRYIRYANETEELYALRKDLNEWSNVAANPEFQAIKNSMRASAPQTFAEPGRQFNRAKDLILEGETFRWNVVRNK